MLYENEKGYIELLKDLLKSDIKNERNGDTYSMFGNLYKFDISNNKFPLLTTKYVSFKNIFYELMWFINGKTDSKILDKNNVKIWNQNSNRETLNNLGFINYNEGECGPIYGWQWRSFNADYPNKINMGFDQFKYIINEINKGSRRAVLSAWNPLQLEEMVLPPCHLLYTFYISGKNKEFISCHMNMRSNDTFLGLPYNIASTALLTYMLAKVTNKIPKEICISVTDAHLYIEHVNVVNKQILNPILDMPEIKILKKYENDMDPIKWIEELEFKDIEIINYTSAESIKAKMLT
jgi:thymidylate synthase